MNGIPSLKGTQLPMFGDRPIERPAQLAEHPALLAAADEIQAFLAGLVEKYQGTSDGTGHEIDGITLGLIAIEQGMLMALNEGVDEQELAEALEEYKNEVVDGLFANEVEEDHSGLTDPTE